MPPVAAPPAPSTAQPQRFSRVDTGGSATNKQGAPQSAMDGLSAVAINKAIGAASELEPIVPGSLAIGTEIGKGRFKRVHRGWSSRNGAVVVLCYTVAEAATATLSEADQNEINITARLAKTKNSERYIPRVYGSHVEGGNVTIAQELALWGSLKVALKEKKIAAMLSPMHKTYAAMGLLRAMGYLGHVGVVHADMACRNVLVCWLEENPKTIQVKVTDFGLAVQVEPDDGFIIHKQPQATRWCSPEMISEQKLSHLADVWGTGATIWEMFANGEMPWVKRKKREDVGARLKNLAEKNGAPEGPDVSADFPAPPGMPPEVHAAMMTCFIADEATRPKAGDVANQIARWAGDEEQAIEMVPLQEVGPGAAMGGKMSMKGMDKDPSMMAAMKDPSMMAALSDSTSFFKVLNNFLASPETSKLVDPKTLGLMKQEIAQAQQREAFLRTSGGPPTDGGPMPVCEDVVPLRFENNSWVATKAETPPTDGTWSMWTYTSPAMKRQDFASELDALLAFEKNKNAPCMLKDPTGSHLAAKSWASNPVPPSVAPIQTMTTSVAPIQTMTSTAVAPIQTINSTAACTISTMAAGGYPSAGCARASSAAAVAAIRTMPNLP
mmetsp:Transcript_66913/g.160224  ORF Transcript_66913/g.160224 Transcript_66913/m.160224 type:complete len:610 (-) Transcript_66913:166-1995(-)